MRKLSTSELLRPSKQEYLATEKLPVVVVLDNVRSAYNVGSVFRTAEAFLAEAVYLCGITAHPPHKEIRKTALGAEETVRWEYHRDVEALATLLKQKGYLLVAVEQTDSSMPINRFRPLQNRKYAFFFGNEVTGISDAVLPLMDLAIEIPQFGTKHSLNISVCGGIVLWHYLFRVKYSK